MFSKAPRFPVEEVPLSRVEKQMHLLKRELKKDAEALSLRQRLFLYRDPFYTKSTTTKKPKTAGRARTKEQAYKFLNRSKSTINITRQLPKLNEKTITQKMFAKELDEMKKMGIRFEKPPCHPLHNTTLSNFKLRRDKKTKNVEQLASERIRK